ncbi:MAG TPA: hypothetical protein VLK58_18600 [Conexibacter sp.]|nr:hypothetical protein [Conexibacter sp.]
MSLLRRWRSLWEPDPDGWYVLGDEMRARHPGIELFASHPELGLVEQEEGHLSLSTGVALGTRWLALSAQEQRLRLRDLLRAILDHAAAGEQACFRVDHWACGPWTRRLAALPGVAVEPSELVEDELAFVEGELTPAAIALLTELPDDAELRVKRDGRLWCEAPDGVPQRPRPGFGLWLDPWHAGALEEELSKAWWNAAEERRRAAEGRPLPAPRDGGRVSRETRAQVLVGWDHAGRWLIALGILGLGPLLPLPFVLAALVTLVVVLGALWQVEALLRRWYERS